MKHFHLNYISAYNISTVSISKKLSFIHLINIVREHTVGNVSCHSVWRRHPTMQVYTHTHFFLALRRTKNSILALHIAFSLHTHRITLLFCLLQYTSNSFCPSLPLSVHLFCWVVRSWEGLYITSPPPVGQRSGGGEKKKRGRERTGSISLFFSFSAHTYTQTAFTAAAVSNDCKLFSLHLFVARYWLQGPFSSAFACMSGHVHAAPSACVREPD